MNFNNACNYLELIHPFSREELKKKYKLMALKFHPDKHMPDADHFYKNRFTQIQESYEFLQNTLDEPLEKSHSNYNNLFDEFLGSFFCESNDTFIKDIIKTIILDYQNLSIHMFEKIDNSTGIKLFEFINSFKEVLFIDNEVVERIKEIIINKIKQDNMFILNPSMEDLLNDNIYILEHDNKKYFVPLWHDEVYYKNKNSEIIVKCVPQLDENVYIIENNNLHITIYEEFKSILLKKEITYSLGKKVIKIPVSELYIKKVQNYLVKKEGISRIDSQYLYNNENKGDILFTIHLI